MSYLFVALPFLALPCLILLSYFLFLFYCFILLFYFIVLSYCFILLFYLIVLSYCFISTDLVCRRNAVGDTLRATYDQLSRDPNSLANLDQDLPNFAQHQVKIIYKIYREKIYIYFSYIYFSSFFPFLSRFFSQGLNPDSTVYMMAMVVLMAMVVHNVVFAALVSVCLDG